MILIYKFNLISHSINYNSPAHNFVQFIIRKLFLSFKFLSFNLLHFFLTKNLVIRTISNWDFKITLVTILCINCINKICIQQHFWIVNFLLLWMKKKQKRRKKSFRSSSLKKFIFILRTTSSTWYSKTFFKPLPRLILPQKCFFFQTHTNSNNNSNRSYQTRSTIFFVLL